MDCLVTRALEVDLDEVVALERAIFSDPWSLPSFRDCLREILLVARSGPAIRGYLGARAVPPDGEILTIGVAAEARNRGVGSKLMQEGLGELARLGVDRIFLEVRESNSSAIMFYEKRGFAAIARRSAYYSSPPEDALVMMRQNFPV